MLKSFAAGRLLGAAYGSGDARVLALPGWMRTHRDFDTVLEGLDAIALDLPGFGATAPPPEPWTTTQYAEWILPVLDEMTVPVVVVGHSFGGRVAAQLVEAAPEHVGALVLSGVPLLPDPQRPRRRAPLAFRVGRALHRRGLFPDARMEAMRQRFGSEDYRAASGVMRGVLVSAVNESYASQLAAIRCPVELVWGEGDDQAPVSIAEAALSLCTHALLTRCPGGHFLPMTSPECIRAAVDRQRSLLSP